MFSVIANLVGGIGFFFLGGFLVQENIKYLITHQIQIHLSKWTHNVWKSAILGFILGIIAPSILVALLTASFITYSGLSIYVFFASCVLE